MLMTRFIKLNEQYEKQFLEWIKSESGLNYARALNKSSYLDTKISFLFSDSDKIVINLHLAIAFFKDTCPEFDLWCIDLIRFLIESNEYVHGEKPQIVFEIIKVLSDAEYLEDILDEIV